jgi:hypothetical protein
MFTPPYITATPLTSKELKLVQLWKMLSCVDFFWSGLVTDEMAKKGIVCTLFCHLYIFFFKRSSIVIYIFCVYLEFCYHLTNYLTPFMSTFMLYKLVVVQVFIEVPCMLLYPGVKYRVLNIRHIRLANSRKHDLRWPGVGFDFRHWCFCLPAFRHYL